MTRRAVRRAQTPIDPMFFIPEDVDELIYHDKTINGVSELDDEDFNVVVEYGDESSPDDADYNDTPETPQVLGIVPPQVIRMGDSGAEVVDVVFEVEDVGADTYEFRVTKI